MAAVIIKEVNRMPGYTPSGNILAGQAVMLSNDHTIIQYAWDGLTPATAPAVLGIALETNVALSSLGAIPVFKLEDPRGLVDPIMRPTSDRPSGDTTITATFYEQINRGGLISVALNGGVIDLYDDGRGLPYDPAPTPAYAVNQLIYVHNVTGLITSAPDDGSAGPGPYPNQAIGICLAIPTTPNPILRIKLTI